MNMDPSMIQNQLNQTKTLTENGAIAYETSGHPLQDMVFELSALRIASETEILRMFTRAFYDAPHDTTKALFWMRDCRGGAGERRIFRVCLKWLAENRPEIARAVLTIMPEYGRFDDWWGLLDTSLRDELIRVVKIWLADDEENCKHELPFSLLAKWCPSNVTSSKETRRYAEILRNGLGMTPREYRKTLSALRSGLDVVERKMSANKWEQIHYPAVPSKANLIYKDAFMRHDRERRTAYLESLKNGETKINAGVLQPHEIVGKYFAGSGYDRYVVSEKDDVLEELWKALPDITIGNTIVVEDTSGSMTWLHGNNTPPIEPATALAIYLSEHNDATWKDKIISFSSKPRLLDMSNCNSLHEKVTFIGRNAECSNTDVEATMLLILETAIANNCSQEDMPGTVILLSDCQFDSMVRIRGRYVNASLFDNIAREFEAHGYKLPKIVFWNLAGAINKTIPMQENDLGVVLMSGFSVQLMNMAMSSKTDPYEALLETINAPRYDAVEEALKGIV